MQNGLSRSITEIKEKAKEDARKAARGASAMSLIKFARVKSLNGQECELSGDLRGALNAYITSGTLAQMAMETVEYKMESQPGKKGVLFKEFFDFSQVSTIDSCFFYLGSFLSYCGACRVKAI